METRTWRLSDSVVFPVSLVVQTYVYYEPAPAEQTVETVRADMISRALGDIAAAMDGTVTAHSETLTGEGGAAVLRLSAHAVEQIGVEARDDSELPAARRGGASRAADSPAITGRQAGAQCAPLRIVRMTGRRGGRRPPVSTANDESKVQTIEKTVQIEQTELLMAIFGAFDENIKLIERELGVSVISRGSELKISGEDAEADVAARTIGALAAMAGRGEAIGTQTVQYVIGLARDGREAEVHTMSRDVLCITAKGKPVKAKTLGPETLYGGHPQEHHRHGRRSRGHGQDLPRRRRRGRGLPR